MANHEILKMKEYARSNKTQQPQKMAMRSDKRLLAVILVQINLKGALICVFNG